MGQSGNGCGPLVLEAGNYKYENLMLLKSPLTIITSIHIAVQLLQVKVGLLVTN